MNIRIFAFTLALMGAFTVSGQALVTTDFYFSVSGIGLDGSSNPEAFSGSAVFETTLNGPGSYTINNVTGSFSIPGLLSSPITITGASFFNGADNLIYFPASPYYVDLNGVSFTDAISDDFNIYYDASRVIIADADDQFRAVLNPSVDAVSFSTVPEPAQYGLFVFLAVVSLTGWRRFSRRVA